MAGLDKVAARLRGARRKEFGHVLIVTYGRSGSTLVQGLLNTLPRTVVRGENGLYVVDLFRAMASLRAVRKRHLKHGPRQVSSAFYGLHEIKPRSFVTSARQLMDGHLLGSLDAADVDVLGFKEVLWHRVEPEETEDFFAFLDDVFPGCRYVLNHRDPEAAMGSGFWQDRDQDHTQRAITRVLEIHDHLRATRPERVLDLSYEQVTSDDREVSDAQLWALAVFAHGSCDDALLARMRETLSVGHGPFPFGESRERNKKAKRGRTEPDG